MSETLPLFTAVLNQSVYIESRPDYLTGDAGVLVQRAGAVIQERLLHVEGVHIEVSTSHGGGTRAKADVVVACDGAELLAIWLDPTPHGATMIALLPCITVGEV